MLQTREKISAKGSEGSLGKYERGCARKRGTQYQSRTNSSLRETYEEGRTTDADGFLPVISEPEITEEGAGMRDYRGWCSHGLRP